MTTPEVAKDLFKEVQAAFAPIAGAPDDDDVKRLTKAFINALQSIDVPGGAINLSNLLLSDAEHEDKHGVGSTFERMAIPLPAYGDSIASAQRPSACGRRRSDSKPSSRQLSVPDARSSSPPSSTPGSSP